MFAPQLFAQIFFLLGRAATIPRYKSHKASESGHVFAPPPSIVKHLTLKRWAGSPVRSVNSNIPDTSVRVNCGIPRERGCCLEEAYWHRR